MTDWLSLSRSGYNTNELILGWPIFVGATPSVSASEWSIAMSQDLLNEPSQTTHVNAAIVDARWMKPDSVSWILFRP